MIRLCPFLRFGNPCSTTFTPLFLFSLVIFLSACLSVLVLFLFVFCPSIFFLFYDYSCLLYTDRRMYQTMLWRIDIIFSSTLRSVKILCYQLTNFSKTHILILNSSGLSSCIVLFFYSPSPSLSFSLFSDFFLFDNIIIICSYSVKSSYEVSFLGSGILLTPAALFGSSVASEIPSGYEQFLNAPFRLIIILAVLAVLFICRPLFHSNVCFDPCY